MSDLVIEGRAAERLAADTVGWLVTVRGDGQPQASPVWFLWNTGRLYIQSQPTAAKLTNIDANNRVSFHLDDDGSGSDIVTVEATADVLTTVPQSLFEKYIAKYEEQIRNALRTTPEQLAATYSTTIRLTPTRVRAW